MEILSRRSEKARKWSSFLCPDMEKKLVENAQQGHYFNIVKANENKYGVDDRGKVTVDLATSTCSCEM